ncbi:MAG: hypothetical protein IJ223_03390 [Clostridia bacterium]|nr:hypothetical protein [Clostridia bacterium]
MNQLKNINEFNNITEYFNYLRDIMIDLEAKKNRALPSEMKNYYQSLIDDVIKKRTAIRDVVLVHREQLIYDKLNQIQDDEIENFINSKKKEKEFVSGKKLNAELDVALYNSISELDNNFFAPLAKYAKEYDSSDFFITRENFEKSYLVKDENGELAEYPATFILFRYLGHNQELAQKISDRQSLKEDFLEDYVKYLKISHPSYSDEEIRKLANDNLISHSPDLVKKLDEKYPFTNEDYDALANAYKAFCEDYAYLNKEDITQKRSILSELKQKFSSLAEIPDGKNLKDYLISKFESAKSQIAFIKSASQIKKNDAEIVKYFSDNNLLKNIELSTETKADYAEKLSIQNALLQEIIKAENNSNEYSAKIKDIKERINTLNHTNIMELCNCENSIADVEKVYNDYNVNCVIPLKETKKEYEEYKEKNKQELSLVPYQKRSLFQRFIGMFNGQNKLQNEFNAKCQEYEAKIKVLNYKLTSEKPVYANLDNVDGVKINGKFVLFGSEIQDYLSKLDHTYEGIEIEACNKVLEKYKAYINEETNKFKEKYSSYIDGIENCSSCEEIFKKVSTSVSNLQRNLEIENSNNNIAVNRKRTVCDEYNKNAQRSILPDSSVDYLNKINDEYTIQLQKLSEYKGENPDSLEYKIAIENKLKEGTGILSEEDKTQLEETAKKKANAIINDAINKMHEPEESKVEIQEQEEKQID